MIQLVTMKQAKDQIHEYSNFFDSQIDMYIWQASALVIEYCKIDLGSPEQLPWPEVPRDYQLWTLQLVATMFKNRETDADMLSEQLVNMMRMRRLPTLA